MVGHRCCSGTRQLGIGSRMAYPHIARLSRESCPRRSIWAHLIVTMPMSRTVDNIGNAHVSGEQSISLQAVLGACRPSSSIICLRMTNFWILPVTVIGNASTKRA